MAVALGTIVCWAEPWLVRVALGSGTFAAAAVLGGAFVAVAALVVLVVGTCRWVSDVLHRYSHHSYPRKQTLNMKEEM